MASKHENAEIVEYLIEKEIDVNQQVRNGYDKEKNNENMMKKKQHRS